MSVSVILPTYNRADVLRKTLQGYAEQGGDPRMIEVLVVDDGSKDGTPSVVEDCQRLFPTSLRYLHQENRGLAAARNHGIREARGKLILFGDDDIIPSPRMVAEHVAWHCKYPEENVGVLGYVAWARELHPTPFMKWSGLYGPQFNFGYFKPGGQLDYWHAYFCNTSVKSSFLAKYGVFDERFCTYGNEDIELSYRLCQKGYQLLYNPAALGHHYKYETFEDTLRRVQKLYASGPVFAETEAGQHWRKLALRKKSESSKKTLKRFFRPLKAHVMPLFKPICNTHVPLPGWLYNMVFYHYVKASSMLDEAELSEQEILDRTGTRN